MVINVIENKNEQCTVCNRVKNEQCTVWNRVVMLIMTQKTGDGFYIISYNFVIVVSVKWERVNINPLHSLFSLLGWPASQLPQVTFGLSGISRG